MADHGPMTRILSESLKHAQIGPQDKGALSLAIQYASLIDAADELNKEKVVSDLGPKYLAALAALRMTPASRAVGGTKGGVTVATVDPAANALANLRSERGAATRTNNGTAIHTSTA